MSQPPNVCPACHGEPPDWPPGEARFVVMLAADYRSLWVWVCALCGGSGKASDALARTLSGEVSEEEKWVAHPKKLLH